MTTIIIKLSGCIITDNQDGILLLHRNTATHKHWEIPGGKIEEGEDAEAAAIREISEELGVAVQISKLLGSKEFAEGDNILHYIWFSATITSGLPKIMEPNTFDDLRYFSLFEMRSNPNQLSLGAQNFIVEIANN